MPSASTILAFGCIAILLSDVLWLIARQLVRAARRSWSWLINRPLPDWFAFLVIIGILNWATMFPRPLPKPGSKRDREIRARLDQVQRDVTARMTERGWNR